MKHVENVYYLHDPRMWRKLSQTLKIIRTIWKIGRQGCEGLDTRLQGQSTLDECVEEYGRGGAERKRCVVNLV